MAIAYRLSRDELIDVRDEGAVKEFTLKHFNVLFVIRRSESHIHEIEVVAFLPTGHSVKAFANPEGDMSLAAMAAANFVTLSVAQAILEPHKSSAASELNARACFMAMVAAANNPIIPEGADEAFLAGITSIVED